MEYRGWTYTSEIDEEEDNRKIMHLAVHEDGTTKVLDLSPYKRCSAAMFIMLVELNFPTRTSGGPLSQEEVYQLMLEKNDE